MDASEAVSVSPATLPEFFAALNGLLTGELARFRSGLAGPDDPRPSIAITELLDDAMMAEIITRFDAKFGKTDPRAILSMWSAICFTDVLPPLLTANILLDLEPALTLDRVRFVMSPTHRVEALQIGPDLTSLAGADTSRRFDALVSGLLMPLIEFVAARGGVTQRVLWSNAGNVFEAFCRRLAAIGPGRPGLAHAQDLLKSRTLGDGRRNPLFEPVRTVQDKRIRRVCCIRYMVPNKRVCGICPLPIDSPARRANAESA